MWVLLFGKEPVDARSRRSGTVFHRAAPERLDNDEAEAPDLEEPVGNGAREAGSSGRSGRVFRPDEVTAQRSKGSAATFGLKMPKWRLFLRKQER